MIFSDDRLSRRAQSTFSRFSQIYGLDITALIARLLFSLQGDDEADGGQAPEEDEELAEVDYEGDHIAPGRGFEVAKGSSMDLGKDWKDLKE